MRRVINKSMLVSLSGVLVLAITRVSAAPQHQAAPEPPKPAAHEPSTATPKESAATPARSTKAPANQAPPIPPVESTNSAPKTAEPAGESMSADGAVDMLEKGNARWVADKPTNPHDEVSRRASLAESGQHPFATILTCSDSRLPAERLFDCGVGDIFVVRVAGNIMGVSEAGTIEYGLEHLHTPLLVVMGHSKCGAVSAAVTNAHLEGSIAKLVQHIEPAVTRAHKLHPDLEGAALVPEAVTENVWQSIFDLLKSSEISRAMVREGKVKIVGAVCDISTGKVEFLGEHPWQSELIVALSAEGSKSPAPPAIASDPTDAEAPRQAAADDH